MSKIYTYTWLMPRSILYFNPREIQAKSMRFAKITLGIRVAFWNLFPNEFHVDLKRISACKFGSKLVVFLSQFPQKNPPENVTPLKVFFTLTSFIILFIILINKIKIKIKILQVELNFHAEIRFKSTRIPFRKRFQNATPIPRAIFANSPGFRVDFTWIIFTWAIATLYLHYPS